MADRIYLDRQWSFAPEFQEDMISAPMSEPQIVDVPHTCKETPFHYFDETLYQMVCCYQRTIVPEQEWKGQVVFLTFEAVGHETDVYLNGEHLYRHRCGYTAFTLDISDKLRYGEENLLTVKVNSREDVAQPPFGFVIDYMTYGGIYRDVYLEIKHPIHIADVFLKPSLSQPVNTAGYTKEQIKELRADGQLATSVTLSEKAGALKEGISFRQLLDDRVIVEGPLSSQHDLKAVVGLVAVWDVESPSLYKVTTQLLYQGELMDEVEHTVGFREAVFRKDGFYLNGRKVLLRGLNRHQSYPYVGYAMPASMQRLDARILKEELAVNAVRTSHYPQSHDFMDECDRLGLLVFTEIPGWQHIGDEEWKQLAIQNVKDMVKQYRNHTSIILWGVRINESPDDDDFYRRTNEAARELDDTRPTGGVRCIKKSHLFEDVYTYNDFYHSGSNEGCEPKAKVTSDVEKAYLVSEYNGHMFPTKTFDAEEHRMEHALRHANVLDAVKGQGDIAGSFGWCMFDYNTHKDFGSGDRICYHGVMDMFRNPKMAADIYAAQGEERTVLSLSSTMDIGEHPACNRGDTYIFSNADSVRMYKNDILLKEYFPTDSTYRHLDHGPILINDYVGDEMAKAEGYTQKQGELVKYCLNSVALNGFKITGGLVWAALRLVFIYHMDPGTATALYNKYVGDWGGESKAYRLDAVKNGKVVKSITKAPMKQTRIKVDCSQDTLQETHTYDVAELRIRAEDEYGNVLPFFGEALQIETTGPIQLIGPSVVPFRGGMTGLYVKSTGESGAASVKLSCEGMAPVEIKLNVLKEEK